jgi:hypothetical protein
MKSLIWSVSIGTTVLAAFAVMPSDVFSQGQPAAAHAQRPATADKDCEDIALPDGTVAECPSAHASQTAAIAHAMHVDVSCPAPTRDTGARGCVLDDDVVLDAPLQLAAFTRLDCQGHRLLPSRAGVPENSRTTAKEYVASSPEVAIVLTKALGVTVENCRIGSLDPLLPFDFGVVTLGGKVPGDVVDENGAMQLLRTHIQNNTIDVRYVGVLIGESDNTQVTGNDIVAMIGARGVGIDITGNSDRNHVVGNSVTAHATADANTLVPLFPGTAPSPQRPRGIRMNLGFGRVTNFCLAGDLLQIPGREAALTDSSLLQEDNLVESNYIDFGLAGAPFGIATAAGAVRPVIASNTITGAHQALHFSGLGPGELFGVAGHCSLDASRACGANSDCNINGCDTASKGACIGARTLTLGAPGVAESLGATDPLVVGNTVDGSSGKVEIGMWVAIPSPHATILQNTVINASLAGIRINNQSLEDTTVAGNTVTGNRFGLALVVMPNIDPRASGGFFRSKISLNDFVGSTRQAIATGVCKNVVSTSCETSADCGTGDTCVAATMLFPAELSVDGQGNYWGRSCADGGGFRGAGNPDALGLRDTSAPNVTDSNPYGVPVAGRVGPNTLRCQ